MDERILKWLFDIKFAIDEIDSYFGNEERNFFEYRRNTMLKRAVERDLEIIGLRNQVIHSYDNISDENIWSILTNHLPKLKIEIENLIGKS
jgi:uncharacterized protein with HEPN domain